MGDPHLVAYVVLDSSGTDTGSLSNFLQQHLPAYMVPAVFRGAAGAPADLLNGKVNRRALPDPDWTAHAPDFVPPGNQTEQAIAAIWKEVLVSERMSTRRSFSVLEAIRFLLRVSFRVYAKPLRLIFRCGNSRECHRRKACKAY